MKVGSLFAGIGGIDLGFQQAGFDILWANEIDRDACKTYKLNFPETKLFEGDIRKLDASKLENVDIITAGFPCQPFSVCGKQKGFGDDRGNLFFEIMRIADAIEPKIIFLENVANLVEHDKGRTFNVIHNELVSRGYYLRYLVADACDYCIPQHRTRTYLLAFRDVKQCESYRFPDKVKLEKRVFDILDKSVKVDDCFYLPENSPKYNKMAKAITDDNQIYRFSDYGIQIDSLLHFTEYIYFTHFPLYAQQIPCLPSVFIFSVFLSFFFHLQKAEIRWIFAFPFSSLCGIIN